MEQHLLCRVCFQAGQYSLSEYEVSVPGKSISIQKMIQKFSGVEIVDENAPQMICESCTQELVQSYLFFEKIQEADERILRLLSGDKEVEQATGQENTEEEETLHHDPQNAEEQYTEECDDLSEDIADSHIVEEVYLDAESTEETEELISFSGNTSPKRKYDGNDEIPLTESRAGLRSSCRNASKETELKRKICSKRRDKQNKEIYESGSFVITRFTSSAAAKAHMDNNQLDNAEAIRLRDIRTMNFETVEIEAKNMSVIPGDDQGELPIDDSRVYLCQYCPKAFSSSSFLIAHVRKSHGCKYCAQMFEKSIDLFRHIRETHATFKCVICEKEFFSNSNLRNHLKSIHKIRVPANVSILSYKKDEKS